MNHSHAAPLRDMRFVIERVRAAQEEPDAAWAQGKIGRMRYGVQWLLPDAAAHRRRATAQNGSLP